MRPLTMAWTCVCALLLCPDASGQTPTAGPDAATLAEFQDRLSAYVELHREVEAKLPRLPDDAAPEAIDQHQRRMEQLMRAARPNAKQGDIFTPAMQGYIREVMEAIAARPDGRQLRASILDENPVWLSVKVNDRYPDAVPLATMPPQLLEHLPEMPEELEYRYVGASLILLDPHAHLIVDFVSNALPE